MVNDTRPECVYLKRFVRYLYEYDGGKRVRNIEFVRLEQEETEAEIQIGWKGLSGNRNNNISTYII